jgi:maltose alpha-D-glucosyltransferase/alpha-amylase
MQWSPDRNGGFSRADPQGLFLPPIMDPIYGYQSVNVEAQAREPTSLLNWTRRILAVRRAYKAFGRGTLEFLKPGNRAILAYLRKHEDEVLLCVANLRRSAQPVELDLAAYRGRVPVELLGRSSFPPIGELPYLLTLPRYGFYWFELAAAAAVPSWHEERLAPEEPPWLVLFGGLQSFEIRSAGAKRELAERLVRRLETDVLPRFLPSQRWFAAKNRRLDAVRLASACRWETQRGTWLLAMIDAELAGGGIQRYFMPLALDWTLERAGPAAAASVARVRQRSTTGSLFDAFAAPDFGRDLLDSLAAGKPAACTDGVLEFSATPLLAELIPNGAAGLAVRRTATEGSNLTLLVGERVFLKGFRRVHAGVHPEWEMGRFLTEESPCAAVVPVAGVVEHRLDDTRSALVLVQAAVANQGDGWRYTLNYLERALDDELTRAPGSEPDHSGALFLVRQLAVRTADLHRALAVSTGNPAFEPEPLDAARMGAWATEIVAETELTVAALERRRGELPADAAPLAAELAAESDRLRARLTQLGAAPVKALATRYHGDYHLGQALLTENDFVITDLEGEPAREFAERRRKGSPLKDVASMLRSFSYAKAVTLRNLAARRNDDFARAELVLEGWRREVDRIFRAAYAEAMAGCGAYPSDAAEAQRLLELAAVQRLLYEVRYELDHRPDWVAVPLQDLRSLFTGRG